MIPFSIEEFMHLYEKSKNLYTKMQGLFCFPQHDIKNCSVQQLFTTRKKNNEIDWDKHVWKYRGGIIETGCALTADLMTKKISDFKLT